jgi:hypothetical protein
MTSLVCWIGVDSRGPTSLYLASDSRISWGKDAVWDTGRKVFSTSRSPDLFGYVGQVDFPTLALAQLVDVADAGSLFPEGTSCGDRRSAFFTALQSQFASYPARRCECFTIVHAGREDCDMRARFAIHELSWTGSSWDEAESQPPGTSGIVKVWGSGTKPVHKWYDRWSATRQSGATSRSVFSAFCEALAQGEDPYTGGAPQLVSVVRRGNGEPIGVVQDGRKYLFGLPVTVVNGTNALEWRNSLFERCDGHTGRRFPDAQAHRVARGLGAGFHSFGAGTAQQGVGPDDRSPSVPARRSMP